MEDHTSHIVSLQERAAEYLKTNYELIRLKTIDKTADVVSSLIPHFIFLVIVASFILYVSLGFAFWLGELLGKNYFGFFVVGAFYVLIAIVLRLFVRKWLKRSLYNYIIKLILK